MNKRKRVTDGSPARFSIPETSNSPAMRRPMRCRASEGSQRPGGPKAATYPSREGLPGVDVLCRAGWPRALFLRGREQRVIGKVGAWLHRKAANLVELDVPKATPPASSLASGYENCRKPPPTEPCEAPHSREFKRATC